MCSSLPARLSYHAPGADVRSLQCDGDAVQKYEEQDDVIKHLVTDDPQTPQPEPGSKHSKGERASAATPQVST